jgi:hypothetical protein
MASSMLNFVLASHMHNACVDQTDDAFSYQFLRHFQLRRNSIFGGFACMNKAFNDNVLLARSAKPHISDLSTTARSRKWSSMIVS